MGFIADWDPRPVDTPKKALCTAFSVLIDPTLNILQCAFVELDSS